MFELIYTSVPHGLLPGRSGFTTAAMSAGMPPNLIAPLENSSGYNFTFVNGELPAEYNPVCCSYLKMRYGNQMLAIASYIAPNGLDYTRRNNKIAHHILLENSSELRPYPGGAAELFTIPDLFCCNYEREPAELPFRKLPPSSAGKLLPAQTWQDIANDSGYAAWIAEKFRSNQNGCLYIKYPIGTPAEILLHLTMEVCALLEPQEKSNFTFSTYFRSNTVADECFLRFIPDFSPLCNSLRQLRSDLLLDLDALPPLPPDFCRSDLYKTAVNGIINHPEKVSNSDHTSPGSGVSTAEKTVHKLTILTQENPVITKIYTAVPQRDNFRCHTTEKSSGNDPQTNSRRKKFFIGSAIGFFVVLLSVIIIYAVNFPPAEPQNRFAAAISNPPTSTEVTVPASSPAINITVRPSPSPSPTLTVPAMAENAAPEKSPTTAVSPRQLPLTAAANWKKLPPQSALLLFANYQSLVFSTRQCSLQLPADLKNTREINIKIRRIGNINNPPDEFITRKSPLQLEVAGVAAGSFPPRPVTSSDHSHGRLSVEYNGQENSLHFQFNGDINECTLPQAMQIATLYFRTPQGDFRWQNTMLPEYLPELSSGRVIITPDGSLQYHADSRCEKQLKNYLYITIGQYSRATFQSKKFPYVEWNNAVKAYNDQYKICLADEQMVKQLLKPDQKIPTAEEIESFAGKMDAEAENAPLEKLDKLLNDFIDRFYGLPVTPLTSPQNQSATENLQKILDEIEDELDVDKFNKDKKAKYDKFAGVWQQKLQSIRQHLANQVKYAMSRDLLQKKEKDLSFAAGKMLLLIGQIDSEARQELEKMLNTAPDKDKKQFPRAITAVDLQRLSETLGKKVRIRIAEDQEEL